MSELDTIRQAMAQMNASQLNHEEILKVAAVAKENGIGMDEFSSWFGKTRKVRPELMRKQWESIRSNSANPAGIGSLVVLCRAQGGRIDPGPRDNDPGHALSWDAMLTVPEAGTIVRTEWIQDEALPTEPGPEWDGKNDLRRYLQAVFTGEDKVGYVVDSYDFEGKRAPKKGVWDRTAGELIEAINRATDLTFVIGDWDAEVGAWIRFNPLDGVDCRDANVTSFRHALVECDTLPIERQYAIIRQLELPLSALVFSGGKSLHGIVKIDAADFKEYQKRVDFLYGICEKNGLVIDRKNRNPSRLSRLPGVTRNGRRQWLIATNTGRSDWADWADWVAGQNDDLPEFETLADYFHNPPKMADSLIAGVLRQGDKMLMSGPSKAGKSFAMLELAIAIAEGSEWLGWQCAQGRVLYVNLELNRASCYHRLIAVYDRLGLPPRHIDEVDVWNLRGKAMPMTELAPRLIHRALKRKYIAILIDPIYKVITGDENAADQMAKFCNQFDKVCYELGAAVIYCHHHSKGSQGQKRAADRASGSGVFARDPDAQLDLIELIVSDACRNQLVNRRECEAMAAKLDGLYPSWREQCGEDDAIVADRLMKWADQAGLADSLRAVRAEARAIAMDVTGWRIEGNLRDDRPMAPRHIWFEHPIHRLDDGMLADAKADGEIVKRSQSEAIAQVKERKSADFEAAFDNLTSFRDGRPVATADLAESLGIATDSVTRWIRNHKNETTLRYNKKGVVYREGKSEK